MWKLGIFAYLVVGILLAHEFAHNERQSVNPIVAKWRIFFTAMLIPFWAPLALLFIISLLLVLIYNIIMALVRGI